MNAAPARLVLCMIVRNEAAVIERCLDSVLPHVDAFVISDTGSQDATIDLIRRAADRHAVRGQIHQDAWYNFGHNRTVAAEEARHWVARQGWPPHLSYLVFLDADMVLHVEAGFDKGALSATSYDLVQDDGTLRYWNVRLGCLSHGWQSVGATHEYWQPIGSDTTSARLGTMWIEDRADGGNKADKFERDVRLLTRGLQQEPNNPRYVLYLAQTYFDLGRWTDAERLYSRRWALGGWDEERWLARYRQGLCLLRMNDGHRAAGVLLDAFDQRPSRAEPLWLLARYYRDHHKNHAALMVALRALEIPYPQHDMLFVEAPVYEWLLWEEVMISAYYAGPRYHDIGFAACERLLARRRHEAWFFHYVARNEIFYLQRARAARRGTLVVDAGGSDLHDAAPASRPLDVPIVVELPGCLVPAARYPTIERDGAVPRRYTTVRWNAAHADCRYAAQSFDIPANRLAPGSRRGMEDIRWTVHNGRMWFTAAYYPDGAAGVARIALGGLTATLDGVADLVGLADETPGAEDTWVPWSHGGQLCLITSYDPFIVRCADPISGQLTTIHSSTPAFRAADFRASTAPILIPDRPGHFLALVHELTRRDSGDLQLHRWIEITSEEGLIAYSRPFFFDAPGKELATGLCTIGDELLVTYEPSDGPGRWMTFEWPIVLSSLRQGEPPIV
jgi:hypothetical protein